MQKQTKTKLYSSFLFLLSFLAFSAFASATLIIEPDQGRQPVLEALKQAQSTVDLAIYGFTDPELMQAFIQAKNNGKKVRILLQHYPYKSLDENLLAIQRFSASHLDLTFAPPAFYLLHQKTLLLDRQRALVMTFNFTRSTFQNERNFALLLDDPAMVQEIQRVFDADWQNQPIKPVAANLFWSPDNSREKLLKLIASAQSELKIYAQGLSDYQVIGALASAARRGIQVQILTSGPEPGKKWDYLRKAGVKISFDKRPRIHAKVLLVDQQKALLGSINFTQPSLDKNRELAVLVTSPQVVKQLLGCFTQDWQTSLTARRQFSRKRQLVA